MYIKLKFLPGLSRRLGGPDCNAGQSEWQVEIVDGETAGDVLSRLAVENDKFHQFVFDRDTMRLAEGVTVVLNERLLDLAGGLTAHLSDGDRLEFIPGLTGG